MGYRDSKGNKVIAIALELRPEGPYFMAMIEGPDGKPTLSEALCPDGKVRDPEGRVLVDLNDEGDDVVGAQIPTPATEYLN